MAIQQLNALCGHIVQFAAQEPTRSMNANTICSTKWLFQFDTSSHKKTEFGINDQIRQPEGFREDERPQYEEKFRRRRTDFGQTTVDGIAEIDMNVSTQLNMTKNQESTYDNSETATLNDIKC